MKKTIFIAAVSLLTLSAYAQQNVRVQQDTLTNRGLNRNNNNMQPGDPNYQRGNLDTGRTVPLNNNTPNVNSPNNDRQLEIVNPAYPQPGNTNPNNTNSNPPGTPQPGAQNPPANPNGSTTPGNQNPLQNNPGGSPQPGGRP